MSGEPDDDGAMYVIYGAPPWPREDLTGVRFEVVLEAVGAYRRQVIFFVRAVTGLPIIDAKALIDAAPCVLRRCEERSVAEELCKRLQDEGATASVRRDPPRAAEPPAR